MIWQDMVLDSEISENRLRKAIERTFKMDASEICVTESIESCASAAKLICVHGSKTGPFPTFLTFYLDSIVPDQSTIETVQKLCGAIGCSALISDDESSSPYSMILVDSKSSRRVRLEAGWLDEHDEYRIAE